jgi:hypothetical protein
MMFVTPDGSDRRVKIALAANPKVR